MTQRAEHGQDKVDDTVKPHRWMRAEDEDSGVITHWCVDGDTEHHTEPCPDGAARTGDHADDAVDVGDLPLWAAP